MLSIVSELGAWAWVIAGVLLIALEALAPGVFLVWFGVAALLTGLLEGVFGLSWQAATMSFACLAVLSAVLARKLAGASPATARGAKHLNAGAHGLIGRVFPIERGITAGEGRIRVNDTVWRVTGADAPDGALVRVTEVDGTTLIVVPAR